jgi:uncharacterized membrane protein
VYFLYLAWRLWKSVVTLAVTGNTISGRFFLSIKVPEFKGHRLPLTGSRWDITMADRSSNEADFLCILLYLAWRLWKSVVTLAVKGNTISGRVSSALQRVPEYQGASIAVDRKSMLHTVADRSSNEADFLCILLYLAWRLWKSVVTLVFTGKYYFRSGFSASEAAGVSRGIDRR